MTTKTEKKPASQKKKTAAALLKEKKLQVYKNAIEKNEQALLELVEKQNRFFEINVAGTAVTHKIFGNGIVTEQNKNTISVDFGASVKKFVLPGAFIGGHLTTSDTDVIENVTLFTELTDKIATLKSSIEVAKQTLSVMESKK